MSDKYVRPGADDVEKACNATKRTLTSLKQSCLEEGLDWSKIFDEI